MKANQPNNPLHGVTLEAMLNELVRCMGWAKLGRQVAVRCFNNEPSIGSSLKFLRRTPWARAQVEALYLDLLNTQDRPKGELPS
ncbi:MAG: VF530 family DNA-binding protein [Gammaproteobacteria bacterium]